MTDLETLRRQALQVEGLSKPEVAFRVKFLLEAMSQARDNANRLWDTPSAVTSNEYRDLFQEFTRKATEILEDVGAGV
jgi:hypothetical protein